MKLPELLAPAGSREAFRGALCAGADAVYLGGMKFGARAYAANFSEEEIIESLREAHILGRKIYLTLNILTKESEMEETLSFAGRMYRAGLDGVIVQDLGLAAALHERYPLLAVHASTQMSVTTSDAVRLLKKAGVVRVVPARELSLTEIRAMKQEVPIEIESFIHGAMCYGYSGKCLFSSFLGGRSGNRGRCAGTCRLPYDIYDECGDLLTGAGSGGRDKKRGNRRQSGEFRDSSECYPLSMRDLNVLSILPELIDAGIDSFKIEGRMKSPHYAAGVTALYRKYMDRFAEWDAQGRRTQWKVEKADQEALKSLYLRTSLSTGYYKRRNGRELLTMDKPGYAGTEAALLEKTEAQFLRGLPKKEVHGTVHFRTGEPAVLTLWAERKDGRDPEDVVYVTAEGDTVLRADKRPLSADEIARRIRKTGDSLLAISDLNVEACEDGFLPVSALNALRRQAVSEMENALAAGRRSETDDSGAGETIGLPGNDGRNDEKTCFGHDGGSNETSSLRRQNAGRDTDAGGAVPEIWAMVTTQEQLDAALDNGVRNIIAEWTPGMEDTFRTVKEANLYPALPHILRHGDREKVRGLIAQGCPAAGFYARTLEELQLLKDANYHGRVIADGYLYEWNLRARDLLMEYADRLVLPWELSAQDLRPLVEKAGDRQMLTVYGRIPMMLSAGCVLKTMGECRQIREGKKPAVHENSRPAEGGFAQPADNNSRPAEGGFAQLADRKGARFPVRCVCAFCYNVVYNSLPLSLHRFADRDDPLLFGVGSWICSFTTESGEETGIVLRAFRRAASHKGADLFPEGTGSYTTGHFRKSAL